MNDFHMYALSNNKQSQGFTVLSNGEKPIRIRKWEEEKKLIIYYVFLLLLFLFLIFITWIMEIISNFISFVILLDFNFILSLNFKSFLELSQNHGLQHRNQGSTQIYTYALLPKRCRLLGTFKETLCIFIFCSYIVICDLNIMNFLGRHSRITVSQHCFT